MKKIYTYILMITCAMLFAGCQKDLSDILTAEIEGYQGNEDKVYLNDANFACWSTGDKVWVNGSSYDILIDGDKAIIQNCETNINDVVKAAYPGEYVQSVEEVNGNVYNYQFNIPAEQTYEEKDGKQVVKAPMVAINDGNTLKFKNAGSLMHVTIPSTLNGQTVKKVKSITLSLEGTGFLSGTCTIGYKLNDEDNLTCTWANGSSQSTKLIIPAEYVTKKDFYFYLPKNTNKRKYKIIVEFENGSYEYYTYEKASTKSSAIVRSNMYKMDLTGVSGSLTSNNADGTWERPKKVSTIDDLRALTNTDKYFQLTSDIVIEQSDNFSGILAFKGTFDGNGQTIFNNGTYSIFNTVLAGATIKNVNVQISGAQHIGNYGGIASSLDANGGAIVIQNCMVSGAINGQNGVGGIAAQTAAGKYTIENCTINANVSGSDYAGGIVGYVNSSTLTIKKCQINGTIKCVGNHGVFVGISLGTVKAEECTRRGNDNKDNSISYPTDN